MRVKKIAGNKNRLIQRSLSLLLLLLLAWPSATGAVSPSEGIRGADGSLLSQVSAFAGTGDYADVDGSANHASFRSPESVLSLSDGTVLVSDTQNGRIRQIKDGQVTTFAGFELLPMDSNVLPTGALLDGDRDSAVFYQPKGLAADEQGNVYVADAKNHAIRKISSAGQVSTIAGDGILGDRDGKGEQARFYGPSAAAVAKDGTIYVADTLNHSIRRITPSGQVTTLNAPSERAVEVGEGIVTEAGGFKDGPLKQALFNEPAGIAIDKQGNLYVADSGNHLIRYINLEKMTVTTVAGNSDFEYGEQSLYADGGYADGPAREARFHFPKGIEVTEEGGLIIADSMNHSVRYLFAGQVSTLAGDGIRGNKDGINRNNRLEFPTDVAVHRDGSILIADTYNHQIRLFTLYQLPAGVIREQIDIVYGENLIATDTAPEIVNGRTMIPMRAVSEHLGYIINYNAETKNLRLVQSGRSLSMTVDETEVEIREGNVSRIDSIDTAPYIKEGRVYVPLRFFSETFGYDVDWDVTTRTVILR